MTYEEYSKGYDYLETEISQLDEDINNIQSAIYRLMDVVNDSFEEIIKYSIEELEIQIRELEREKEKCETKLIRYNEQLQ